MNNKAIEIGKQNKEKIKKYVVEYYKTYGKLPTYDEIKLATGISKTRIYEHLRKLQKEGELNFKTQNKKWETIWDMLKCAKVENIEKAKTVILTHGKRLYFFCIYLLEKEVKEISLFDLSTEFVLEYATDTTTTIKQLYEAVTAVGIKVTDCAWSR